MFSCRFEVSFPQNLELLFWSFEQTKIFTFLFQNFRWSSSSYYPSFLSWGPSWAGEKQRTLEVGWTGWFHCVLRYFPSPVATWFSSCTSELGPDTERDHSGAGLCRACFQKYITKWHYNYPWAEQQARVLACAVLSWKQTADLHLLWAVYFVVFFPHTLGTVTAVSHTGDRDSMITNSISAWVLGHGSDNLVRVLLQKWWILFAVRALMNTVEVLPQLVPAVAPRSILFGFGSTGILHKSTLLDPMLGFQRFLQAIAWSTSFAWELGLVHQIC